MRKTTGLLLILIMLSAFAFAEEAPGLEGPYMATTCGQSPGAVMLGMAGMTSGIAIKYDNGLTADAFEPAEYKTLIITTGTSMKGMGAAGTDVDAEIARCLSLADAAHQAGLTVVCAHIEGMARRTDSSDEASIEAIIQVADLILVVEESDSDGFFTDYAREHGLPLIIVKNALELGTVL